jgi:aspartate aminotransferase
LATRRAPDVHLDLKVRGLRNSATLAINERSNELRAQGRQVYKLGLGQSPFPVPEVVTQALRLNAYQKDYLPVRGLPALRDAVAAYHHRQTGITYDGSDVLIGPGSKELMFLVQLVYYGDLVIPTPSWVSYAPQAHILGRQVRWIETSAANGWRLMPEDLEALGQQDDSRPRIVILNSPNNPTGDALPKEHLKAIAHVARRYRMVVLSDEIYGELHHRGQHVSIARYYPEGTIVSSGLSKWCGAGGWRLGTFTFPRQLRWLQDAMAAVASETFTSTSAPIQYAAVRAFEGGLEIERYLHDSRRVLRAIAREVIADLRAARISFVDPRGAFYLFVDFEGHREQLRERGIEISAALSDRLLEETGVALLPGSEFGRPPRELTARLAYVDFDGARALIAAGDVPASTRVDREWVRQYARPIMDAVTQIAKWV